MMKISISFVDGGYDEFEEKNSFGESLLELQNQGYEGKELIHSLLKTDDFAAPPTFVTVKGILTNGTEIDISIPYR